MTEEHQPQDARGAAPLYVGVVALLIAGLQPLILGGLASAGRLTIGEIGLAATAELLLLGVGCGLAGALLRPTGLRLKLGAASLAHAALNLACIWAAGPELIALRAAAGLCGGVMLYGAIGLIARSHRPEQRSGAFVTVQTLAQLLLMFALPRTAMSVWGVDGALGGLAVFSLTATLAAAVGPDAFRPLPPAAKGQRGLAPRTWVGLGAVFLHLAFIVSIWVYIEPLAARSGLPQAQAHLAETAALAAQVLGGAAATLVAARIRPALGLIAAGLVNLGVLAVLWSAPSAAVFVAALAVFGFTWLFVLPLQTALLIRIDPSRRGAMQLGSAQLLGSSAGPVAASLLVGEADAGGALRLGLALLAAAMAMVAVSALWRRG